MENFNLKFNELLIKKGSNNTYISKSKYDDLIVHINQLKNQTEKFKPNDYRLLKKYDLIQISEE